MPPPFKQVDRKEFAAVLEKFLFTRRINGVHMHHTWRPNHAQYQGHSTILGMYLYHTQRAGWQDIAQHITIAPDGSIWLGRNWNLPPASAAGHNGNSQAGPFMFEMIGDFDHGKDLLADAQRATTIDVIARVQRKFGLAPESLAFHNSMSTKTCPGNAVDYGEIVAEVRARHAELATPTAQTPTGKRGMKPFPQEAEAIHQAVEEAITALGRDTPKFTEPGNAEIPHDVEGIDTFALTTARAPQATRDMGLSPENFAKLRPHLVNLRQGKFSDDGEWKTQKGDVDAIFDQHLQRKLDEAAGEPLRIVFFAHGGLVKESAGLQVAAKHIDWWNSNNIYPIYFIWETGFFETLCQLLFKSQEGARNIFSDKVSDPALEELVRALQGPRIWGGMKSSAELASVQGGDGEGGARYVARKLKEFCDRNKHGKIELHAVGHSAGSIFHGHFLAATKEMAVPSFKSGHFLAPAIRVDTFKRLLSDKIGGGKGLDHLTLYTMLKDFELDDNCAKIYRKSLLYMVYYALEGERKTPILGLEQSLREDAELRTLFGLGPQRSNDAEVVFSVSAIGVGRSASQSRTHGGFDDDPATLNSVARRILGRADADPIVEYTPPAGSRSVELWQDQVDWPEGMGTSPGVPANPIVLPPPTIKAPVIVTPTRAAPGAAGRRRALCVGINQYPTAPLAGCIADAEQWASLFSAFGFESALLRDRDATRAAIVQSLNSLIASSAPGDVIAFQYAGHGTQLPDLDGDEAGGDSPDSDEAMCPIDFAEGAFLIDDDLREIFSRIPPGVNLTCFFDCCHSGTITRFAVGGASGANGGRDQRRRSIPASDAMKNAHQSFRERMGTAQRAVRVDTQADMRNVVFSACLSTEVAWESDGHGDFTTRALKVLGGGIDGMTNHSFAQRVTAAFGQGARQRPQLDCAPDARSLPLLQPLVDVAPTAPPITAGRATQEEIAQALEALARKLRG